MFWSVGALTNVRLVAVVVLTVLLQLGLHHLPWSQRLFEIGAVSPSDCALMLLFATIPVTVLELGKLVWPMTTAHQYPRESKRASEATMSRHSVTSRRNASPTGRIRRSRS